MKDGVEGSFELGGEAREAQAFLPLNARPQDGREGKREGGRAKTHLLQQMNLWLPPRQG